MIRACFAALSAFFSVTVSGQSWPDPVANHVVPYQSLGITHGPVLGRITESSVTVWIRTREAMNFEIVVSRSLPFDQAPVTKGTTHAGQDFTGWVTIGKLAPNTRYFYAVKLRGEIVDIRSSVEDPWPSFKTLPDQTSFAHQFNPQGRFNFSFSIGSCQRQRSPKDTYGIYANPPVFDTMWKRHREQLSFHIINGDYTYEETLNGSRTGLESNYKLYLERGRSLNRLLRHVPMFTMFNDHEMTDNIDGAGEVGRRDGNYLVRDPAMQVWEYYANWANDMAPHHAPVRFGAADVKKDDDILFDPNADFSTITTDQISTLHIGPWYKGGARPKTTNRGRANVGVYRVEKIIDQHRLQVSPKFRATIKSPYSIGAHRYFDRVIGNCHFFFLDTRSERSRFKGPDHAHDPKEYILGEVQRKWFLDTAKNTKADFIFVISGDPWVIFHSAFHVRGTDTKTKGDGFAGYVHEREILLQALDEIQKPVLILTGDLHHPFAAQITDNVWEFLCSPMNSAGHPLGTAGLPPLGGWFDSQGRKVKIKWCGGNPDNVHYLRQRHSVYTMVNVNNIVRHGLNDGPGYQYLAFDEPQVVVRFHDGYTGDLLYAEGISTLDAKPEGKAFPKINRFGHWRKDLKK